MKSGADVRATSVLVSFLLLNLVACASPRERVYQAALNDYQHKNAIVVTFARAQVKELVAATKSFHASLNHWPTTLLELAGFTVSNRVPLNPEAFNDVTFAALEDGSVQVHYDVNCSHFNEGQYSFTQNGSVNIKAK